MPSSASATPELSVIVPVLNEADGIEGFLGMLARQKGIGLEVVFSDGGSSDGTVDKVLQAAGGCSFPVVVLHGERGRARQMNSGAAAAHGEWLLFLHADSLLPNPQSLTSALSLLREESARCCSGRVMGHFALRFDRGDKRPGFGYSFCECKARLDRPGCTLGDQGLILSKRFFAEIGPFDESLSVGEDVTLAERVRRCGRIILLPAEIVTSPRRFEAEGFRKRQILNAVIMACLCIGRTSLLDSLPALYHSQDRTRPLDLHPCFREIGARIAEMPFRDRWAFWYALGRYVRDNAWQLALMLDVRRSLAQGESPAGGGGRMLAFYDRFLDRLTDHPPGRWLTAGLVWVWFIMSRRRVYQGEVMGGNNRPM